MSYGCKLDVIAPWLDRFPPKYNSNYPWKPPTTLICPSNFFTDTLRHWYVTHLDSLCAVLLAARNGIAHPSVQVKFLSSCSVDGAYILSRLRVFSKEQLLIWFAEDFIVKPFEFIAAVEAHTGLPPFDYHSTKLHIHA